jgi:hypothetical protein
MFLIVSWAFYWFPSLMINRNCLMGKKFFDGRQHEHSDVLSLVGPIGKSESSNAGISLIQGDGLRS